MCYKKQIFLKDFATFADLQAWFDLHDELRMEAPNLCDDYSRECGFGLGQVNKAL